jgi:parallel beta-helix repeat protein
MVEDNHIHHNNWKGFSMISLQSSTIRNNIVHDNGILAGAGGIHLADQPGCGKPSSNNTVVNNTIHEPRIAGIRITNGSAGNVIFNNLIVASSQSYAIVDETGGNFIDPVTNSKHTSTNGVFVGSGDYHLLPASPGVDRGVFTYRSTAAPGDDRDGVLRPQGVQCDVGAYEHTSATAIGDAPALDMALEQNFPNPFAASTRIAFSVPSEVPVRVDVDVFDARGRRVRSLVRDRSVAGPMDVAWDGRDDRGHNVVSGVYFYRLSSDRGSVTRRMTLVR